MAPAADAAKSTASAPRLDEVPLPERDSEGQPGSPYTPLFDRREKVRTNIAHWLLALVVILGLGLPVAYFLKWVSPSGLKDLLTGVWTPILGIFGAVTGFYYGTHASDRERG
ncbi:MAG TPA: hypothetical protein VNF75_06235 [Candidatus Dormibacteraeota bacterium]|nr:hypothetical protein [Candidatus Dormibacteraeota bacterium]